MMDVPESESQEFPLKVTAGMDAVDNRSTLQCLAPSLNDNLQFHAFLVHDAADQHWSSRLLSRLESPVMGFRCCARERDLSRRLSHAQAILYAIQSSLRTVLVLSPSFLSTTWPGCELVLAQMDEITLHRDVVLLLLQNCPIPDLLASLPVIDVTLHDWWTRLLARIALPDGTPMTEETVLSLSSSMAQIDSENLRSGHLLLSIKSKFRCFGGELIASSAVPDDLLAHGIQLSLDDYKASIQQLMTELRFRLHLFCYSLPILTVFFAILLVVCLLVVPPLEQKYWNGHQTGLELLHGAILWLCILTVYLAANQLARKKMKASMHKKLSKVNTTFIKYNLLVGIESLGIVDWNKYFMHFFYFEIGPCLAHLEEMFLLTCQDCSVANTPDADDEAVLSNSLEVTNARMQHYARDMLLKNSSNYINLLIRRKLAQPEEYRHMPSGPCLCQYVEHIVL